MTTTGLGDTLEQRAADEKLLHAFDRVFSQLEDDPTPIKDIHSSGWNGDGSFYVWLDMVDGRERLLVFRPGEPIPSVGPYRPPTQYARLMPFDEASPVVVVPRG